MNKVTPRHDLKISYDKDIGMHRTYRGYKYQPGYSYYVFKRPGARTRWDYLVVDDGSLKQFMQFVNAEIASK